MTGIHSLRAWIHKCDSADGMGCSGLDSPKELIRNRIVKISPWDIGRKSFGVVVGTCLFFATSVFVARDGELPGGAVVAAVDQQLIDQEVAPIFSQADLREYLGAMPAESPQNFYLPRVGSDFWIAVLARHKADWPMIESWETPSFYLLHDGQEVAQFSGWLREGN